MRDLVLFVSCAAVLIASTACGAQEIGIDGEQVGARTESNETEQAQPQPNLEQEQSAEPLTLSLSAPEVCETKAARRYGSSQLRTNEDGVRVRQSVTIGWNAEVELPVGWQVGGGTPPYTLVIDGETRDVRGAYSGASGRAILGCGASGSNGSFFEERHSVTGIQRFYRTDPQIDSGLQSITAVVTDANGDTAEATVGVYVILDLGTGTTGDILKRGETYRVIGALMTAPGNYEVRVGGIAERECAESDPDPRCGDNLIDFGLVGADAWIALYEDDGQLHSRRPEADGSGGPAGAAGDDLTAAVDSLVESLGKLPTDGGNWR